LTSASATLLAETITVPHSWPERSSSVATCRRVITQHWPISNCHGLITVNVCSLSSMIAHLSSRPAIPSQRSHGSLIGSSITCYLRSSWFASGRPALESSAAAVRRVIVTENIARSTTLRVDQPSCEPHCPALSPCGAGRQSLIVRGGLLEAVPEDGVRENQGHIYNQIAFKSCRHIAN